MPPRPRRSWYQFSLRTMLIVIAVVVAPLSWVTKERWQSRFERKFVEQHQRFDYVRLGGPFDSEELALKGAPQGWWRTLGQQLLGERLVELHQRPESYLKDLTPLTTFTNLRSLSIIDTQVTDLTPLAGLKNLHTLSILDSSATDFTPLAGLNSLRSFTLHAQNARDLAPLAGLTNLRKLDIRFAQVSDLKPLCGLTELSYLWMNDSNVTDEQVDAVELALPNCTIQHRPQYNPFH